VRLPTTFHQRWPSGYGAAGGSLHGRESRCGWEESFRRRSVDGRSRMSCGGNGCTVDRIGETHGFKRFRGEGRAVPVGEVWAVLNSCGSCETSSSALVQLIATGRIRSPPEREAESVRRECGRMMRPPASATPRKISRLCQGPEHLMAGNPDLARESCISRLIQRCPDWMSRRCNERFKGRTPRSPTATIVARDIACAKRYCRSAGISMPLASHRAVHLLPLPWIHLGPSTQRSAGNAEIFRLGGRRAWT
jgi:hypothetical protein